MTTEHIRTKSGLRVICPVDEPQAIKIKVIKAKHVDQMRQLADNGKYDEIPDGVQVVGATRGFVILQHGEHLVRVHRVDWVGYLMADVPRENYDQGVHDAHAQVDAYAQLFEE